MSYNPTIILKYGGLEIEPTPRISIDREPIYAGPHIIGYNPTISIDGYASSVLYSRGRAGQSTTSQSIESLREIQDILHQNGKILELITACDGSVVLRGYGGHIEDFSTEEGDWINYIKYKARLSFTALETLHNGVLAPADESLPVRDNLMQDQLRAIQSFNDSWSFVVPENEAYLYYARTSRIGEADYTAVAEDYSQMDVTYQIRATGKQYFVGAATQAAWESAKNFVQYRLYHQINMFRNKQVLNGTFLQNNFYNSNDNGGPINDSISSSFSTPANLPILDISIVNAYDFYDEKIECSTSESEGTFTATYTCKLKRSDPTIGSPQNSVNNFTVSYEQQNDFGNKTRTITVNGSLNGLLKTNILANIDDGQVLRLPNNGLFFDISTDVTNKYHNAWKDARLYLLNGTIDDLSPQFKRVLEINYASLFPETSRDSPCLAKKGYSLLYSVLAEPKNFSLSHNYRQGTVNYSVTYDTDRSCVQELGFNSITITEKDSSPMYVEHAVIGRTQGPIIQNLNTNNPKEITIKFDGVTRKGCVSGNPFSTGYELQDPRFVGLSAEVCDTDSYVFLPAAIKAAYFFTEAGARQLGTSMVVKNHNANYSPATGSYSVTKSYIVCPPYPTDGTETCTAEDLLN